MQVTTSLASRPMVATLPDVLVFAPPPVQDRLPNENPFGFAPSVTEYDPGWRLATSFVFPAESPPRELPVSFRLNDAGYPEPEGDVVV